MRHGSVRVSSNHVIKAGTEFQSTNSANLEIVDNQEHATNSPLVDNNSDDESVSQNKDINENDQLGGEQPENLSNEPVNKANQKHTQLKIEHRFSKDDEYQQATVLSRGGKAAGKYKSFYNIKNEGDREPVTVDFDAVESWQKCNEDVNLVTGPAKDNILQAKLSEIQNWKNFNVFTEIDNNRQIKISTRWVITTKGPNIKARLVSKGFQEQHNYPIDSPNVSKSTLRIMLSLSTMFKWTCKTTDVKAAFLHSHATDREIYLEPSPESNSSGKLWKLNKAVYGLTDAARQWFDRVKDAFLSLKCTQSKYEPDLFFWYDSNKLQGMTVIHVDDFIHAGTEAFEKQVLNNLQKFFEIGKTVETSFKYIGLNI